MTKAPDRFSPAAREEAKLLAGAQTQLADSERSVARQQVLLDEIRRSGLRTVEAEASLARLEAAVIDRRAKLDALLENRAGARSTADEAG